MVDSNQLIIDTGSSGRMEERAKCTARVGKWAIEIGATRRNKKRIQSFVKLVDFYYQNYQNLYHHHHHQNKIIISGGGKKQQK